MGSNSGGTGPTVRFPFIVDYMAITLLELLRPLTDINDPVVVVEAPAPAPHVEIPEEILADARVEAAAIVAAARREASTLIDDAREQAEAMREAAWQEGKHEGEEAARIEIEEKLRNEMSTYRDDLRADLQEIVDAVVDGRRRLWEQQEGEMLAFVIDISKQVIKTEVQQNENVLMGIVRNAMRRVTDKENMRIRVAASDAPRIKAAREDIMQIVDGIRSLEIVDDRRIGPGGCVIETNAGTIDAKIETQLGEIERTLMESE